MILDTIGAVAYVCNAGIVMHKAKRAIQSVLAPRILLNRKPAITNNINADGSGTVLTVKSADSADACSANTGRVVKRIIVIVISADEIM